MPSVSSNSAKFAARPIADDTADARELLSKFVKARDQQAFQSLMNLHGRMVYGVCRRILRQDHDADDAYQATFLILARDACKIRRPELLGPWLYQVAYRMAMKAKVASSRRRLREKVMDSISQIPSPDRDLWPEVEPWLDQALHSLPEMYRGPVICCDLEGKTHKEAARQLDIPEGTLSARLGKAHELLARRLRRWGVVVSSGTLALLLTQNAAFAAVSPPLAASTAAAVGAIASGQAPAGVVSAQVVALTKGGLSPMAFIQAALVAAAAVGGVVAIASNSQPPEQVEPAAPPVAAAVVEEAPVQANDDLESLGAIVERDPVLPDHPVIGLRFKRQNKFTDEHIHLFKPLTKLASLQLTFTRVTAASLDQIAELSELRTLDLSRTRVNGKKLEPLARLRKLTALHLHQMKLKDDALKELQPLDSLTTLDLRETGITDQGLKYLRSFPELEFLYIDSNAITDAGLQELTDLPNLKHLSIDCNPITDAGMETISKIESLELLSAPQTHITDDGLKHLQNLIHINVGLTAVTDAGLAQLADFSRLQQLRLAGPTITDAGAKHLERIPQLRQLELSQTAITDQGLQSLAAALPNDAVITLHLLGTKRMARGSRPSPMNSAPRSPVVGERATTSSPQPPPTNAKEALERIQTLGGKFQPTNAMQNGSDPAAVTEIDLSAAPAFADEHLPLLLFFPQLTALNLSQTVVTDAPFLDRGSFFQLVKAGSLNRLSVLRLEGLPVSDVGVRILGKLPSLETLDMRQTHLSDAGLPYLRGLANLTTLLIGKNVITKKGLEELAEFRRLETLDLSATQISDEGLEHLKKLRYLKDLNVSTNQVTDAGLIFIGQIRNLTSLNVYGTLITDDGSAHLKHLTGLTSLNIGHNRFSDIGLMELTDLRNLEFIDISDDQVSEIAVERFKQAIGNPRLSVNSLAPVAEQATSVNAVAAGGGGGSWRSVIGWLMIVNVLAVVLVGSYFRYKRSVA